MYMLQCEDTTFIMEFQGFSFEKAVTNLVSQQVDFYYRSEQKSTETVCPHCGGGRIKTVQVKMSVIQRDSILQ